MTSEATRFACGVGLGVIGMIAAATLHGDIDIPVGPVCSGVVYVAGSGRTFALGGYLRRLGSRPTLIERSKWVTFGSGFILIVVVIVVAEVLPESIKAVLASAGVWLLGSTGANWIAMRREDRG
jgi:hypothetical protein